MRCKRNNRTHNSDLSTKTDESFEIYNLIDVLRCGNRSISGIIRKIMYTRDGYAVTTRNRVAVTPRIVHYFYIAHHQLFLT